MRNLTLILLGFILLSVSCERSSNEGEKTTKKADKIKTEIDTYNDSLSRAWKEMIRSDDQKIADIKRLLLEVSYTDSYNIVLFDSALAMQKALTSKRYDQVSMGDSKKIDFYDASTDSLLRLTMKVVSTSKGIENHPLAEQLVNDISNADNDVVMYRKHYDDWAKQYNKCLENNPKQLKKLGEPYSSLSKKPLFEIGL